MSAAFLGEARARYFEANAATLGWMLARPRLRGRFVNTKLNPLTLEDYGPADALRGPDYLYGWIQGRGLEAIAIHAVAFATVRPALTTTLDVMGKSLYRALEELTAANGHAYFCYGPDMVPLYPTDAGTTPQLRPADIYTYSDTFVFKGLIAGSARYAPEALDRHIASLHAVISAIEAGRFQMNEKAPLSTENIADQPDDFGPRMILLGAAGMLSRIGRRDATAYAERFIAHIVESHFDPGTGLLRNVPGEDECNVGHGIEFVGFALDYLPSDADPALLRILERILVSSFDRGYLGPGIRLTVSASTGQATSPYCPWWSLPETIRSAALVHERTGSASALRVWRAAHDGFFERFWRATPPIAYQCLTEDGPVDYVPATPDLDPGYHTGLSLLAAIDMIERRERAQSPQE